MSKNVQTRFEWLIPQYLTFPPVCFNSASHSINLFNHSLILSLVFDNTEDKTHSHTHSKNVSSDTKPKPCSQVYATCLELA